MLKTRSATPDHLAAVGDHHHRLARLARERVEEVEHRRGGLGVEVAGGLVGEDQGGVVDQRARDRHPLLLAAREPVGKAARAVGRGPRASSSAAHAPARARRPAQFSSSGKQQVLLDGQQRDQVEELEDEADVPAPEARARALGERREVGAVDAHRARVGQVDPAIRFSSVDLPEPLRPTSTAISPLATVAPSVAEHDALGRRLRGRTC